MCNSNGGEMIIIRDSIENEFYKNLVVNFIPNNEWWIGLYQDLNDPNYSEPGGGWKWATGLILIILLWELWTISMEQSIGGNFTSNGTWNDTEILPKFK